MFRRYICALLALAILAGTPVAGLAEPATDATLAAEGAIVPQAEPLPEGGEGGASTQAEQPPASPEASATAQPSPSPASSATAESSPSPEVSATAESSPSPAPSATAESSPSPEASATAESSPSPEPSATAESSPSPVASATAESSPSPEASATAEPSPTPEPTLPAVPEALAFAQGELVIGYKESVSGALRVSASPSQPFVLRYSSSNPKVVRVDAESGALYGAKTGSATITASIENGPSASCKVTVRKAPTKLSLKLARKTLGAGEALPVQVSFSSGAHSYALKLSSSDESVLRVDGLSVTAVAPGKAKLTAKAYNGKSASATIEVKSAPQSVSFAHGDLTLGEGQTYALSASVNDGAAGEVRYSVVSGGESVSLDGSRLAARQRGEAVVRAETYNGVSNEIRVQVLPAPTQIALSADAVTICVKQRVENPVDAQQDGGVQGGLSYKSSNRSVVAVNATSGAILGKKKGSATITVTAYNGVTAKYKVTVLNAPSKLKLSVRKTLGAGETVFPVLSATNRGAGVGSYSLSSSDEAVLRVDGLSVTAVSPGKAKLTAKAYNGKSASATIEVKSAPEAISFAHGDLTLGEGQTQALSASVNDGAAGEIRYSIVSGGECVSLDGSKLAAQQRGEAVIRAETYNGASSEIRVQVLPAPTQISLSADAVTICVKQRVENPVAAQQDGGVQGGLSYKSSNRSVVAVNATSGAILGKKKGSATITVTAYNGVTAKYKVTVLNAPSKLKLSVRKTLGAGETVFPVLSATNRGAGVGSYSLSSSDEAVLRVEGMSVTAVSPGKAKLTAKAYNGKSASATIEVKAAPEAVSFAHGDLTLGEGQAQALSASVNEGAAGEIRYAVVSGGESVSLDGSKLAAQQRGEAIIRAETYNGASSEIRVQVLPAPTQISLSADAVTICVKQRIENPVDAQQDGGVQGGLSYKSSNRSVVAVNATSGAILGKKKGSATITVTAYNGVTAKYKVTVLNAPTKLKLSVRKTLGAGETVFPVLSATNKGAGVGSYTLSSSDESVLRVDGLNITAVAPGKAKLTAKTYNGKSVSATIEVQPGPDAVWPELEVLTLGVGQRRQAAFCASEGSYARFRYESSDPAVASVDENGWVSGVAEGSATITATAQNGASAQLSVQVSPAPAALTPSGEARIAVGERRALEFSVEPANAVAEYSYESSDERVAKVDAQGRVSGMREGTAIVSVRAHNGAYCQILVTVVAYNQDRAPAVIAHRGASGHCAENSLEAFRRAAELGANEIELDVRRTKDGVLVVHHNAYIGEGKNKKYISDLTMEQIRALNPNACSFDEAMACISELNADVVVEMKVSGTEADVLRSVDAWGLTGRASYGSFSASVLESLCALRPEAETVLMVNDEEVLKRILKEPEAYPYDAISVDFDLLTAERVRDLHLQGKQAYCWTVNDPEEIQRAAAMGVDGVTTDYPDRALA